MKKIISLVVIGLLLLTSACSSESDEIGNDNKSSELVASQDNGAYLSVALSETGVSTKASTSAFGTDESTIGQGISSCTVILYDGTSGKIQSVNDNLAVSNGEVSTKFYTKVKSGLKIMVVANAAAAFAGHAQTLAEAQAIVQSVTAFDSTKLVKVGTADVTFPANFGYPSMADAKANPLEVTVPVKQLTACVRLVAFNVTYTGEAGDVVITGVKLNHVNLSEQTGGTEETNFATASTVGTLPTGGMKVYDGATNAPVALTAFPTFFAFQNTSATATSMTIDFTVAGKAYTKTYTIKHPVTTPYAEKILSGYLYNLTVNMSATNYKVDLEVVCTVANWVGQTFTQVLEEE